MWMESAGNKKINHRKGAMGHDMKALSLLVDPSLSVTQSCSCIC